MPRIVRSSASLVLLVPLALAVGCAEGDPTSSSPPEASGPHDPGVAFPRPAPALLGDLKPGEAALDLPVIDETIEPVDLCAAIPGLCGDTCEEDPSQLGPSSDRKGFGFKLDGCGHITELRLVSGHLALSGQLGVAADVTPGSLGADPGCREVTVTIPGRPAIPPVPPIRNPLTGAIIVPGRPGRPAIPPREVTYRVPSGCAPLRPPSVEIVRPTLDGLSFRTAHRVAGHLVLEAAGSGEVSVRFPIPKLSKSATAIGERDDHDEREEPLRYKVAAGVGLYGVLRGRLTEGVVRLDVTIDDSYLTTQSWLPGSGWVGITLPRSTEVASESRLMVPDTVELAYGVQPAIGFLMEPWPREELGVLPAQPGYAVDLGFWTLRYFDNVYSANERGNLKNDAGAGLEGAVYGGVEYLQPGEEIPCDEQNLSACDWADFHRSWDCCEADLYDQYGTGTFEFAAVTTGEEIDHDPDGYRVTWERAEMEPAPWVDSVLTRDLPTNGGVHFPDGDLSTDHLFSSLFGVVRDTHCAEYYSDAAIVLLNVPAGIAVPELRRRGWDIPLYSKIVGCHQQPADYDLTLSGLAVNCTLDGANPRTVALRPDLDLSQLALPASQRSRVADVTEVPLEVHCRPLVGDVKVVATTLGADFDRDGYSIVADDAVKGTVRGRVPATGEAELASLRVGAHTLEIGDVAFNCALRGPASRPVDVAFEAVTEAPVEADCEPVYQALSATVEALVEDGSIRSKGIGRSLRAKLDAAAAARERGQRGAVTGAMGAFENQLRAQAGKHVSGPAAELLLSHAGYVRDHGFFMP